MRNDLFSSARLPIALCMAGLFATGCQASNASAPATSAHATLLVNAVATDGVRAVIALRDATNVVVLAQTLDVRDGDSVPVDLAFPGGTYALSADVYSTASQETPLGHAESQLVLDEQDQLVKLTIGVPGQPLVSLTHVLAPTITAIEAILDADGSAALNAAVEGDMQTGTIVWGSGAIAERVQRGSTVKLDPALAKDFGPDANLVVQSAGGAVASAVVRFTSGSNCAFCGARRVEILPSVPSDEPCSYSHLKCIARCDSGLTTHAAQVPPPSNPSCESTCAVDLALCRSNP